MGTFQHISEHQSKHIKSLSADSGTRESQVFADCKPVYFQFRSFNDNSEICVPISQRKLML